MNMQIPKCPLRLALAEAIAVKAEADQAAEEGRAAVVRGKAAVAEAEARLATATAGVASAQQARVDALAGGAPTSASATRAARDAETDARDELEATQAALATLKTRVPELDEDARVAGHHVAAAVNSVIAAGIEPFVKGAVNMRRDYMLRLAVLDMITGTGPDGQMRRIAPSTSFRESNADTKSGEPLAHARLAVNDLRSISGRIDVEKDHPTLVAWLGLRAALMADPDTPLPRL